MSRSFESVFEQHGYAVARVKSGTRTIKLARRSSPDVVVLEEGVGDLDALRVCSALSDDPLFDHSIPIVITSAAHVTPATRHAAYAAGAWEYCSHPVDLEALMLKLATFRRARDEMLAQRAERLVDHETGLYTDTGLQRLATQLGARAERKHEPFACVALALRGGDVDVTGQAIADDGQENFTVVAEMCRAQSRKSDVVGRVGDSRLAILAPDTDALGARLLVDRLRRSLERAVDTSAVAGDFRFGAGYCAVPDLAAAHIGPGELLQRATRALDHLQLSLAGDEVLSFDELPPPTAGPDLGRANGVDR